MNNSMYNQNASEGGPQPDASQIANKYRTDSAAKPFGLKKPPRGGRLGSGRTHDDRNRSYMLPNLQQNDSFSQHYKSYGGLDPRSQGQYSTGPVRAGGLPGMNEVDFAGRYKESLARQFPQANMPHLKRIINQ